MLALSATATLIFVPGSAVPSHTLITELSVDGAWVDVSADVRQDPPISCTRGRRDERSHVSAGRCNLTLDNSSGDYSSRLPTSQYYGLLGRNTPVRVSLDTPAQDVSDTFTRTVADGWGSADSGQAYTLLTAGGGSAADFDVAGGEGTMVVGQANSYRLAYLDDVSAVDGDALLGPVNLPAIAAPAGGSLEPVNIAVRMRSSTDYYLFRVEWTTGNSVVAKVYAPGVGDPIATATVFTSGQWTAAEDLMVRAQWHGEALRMRVWQADQSEPSTWNIEVYDGTYTGPGWVGLRAGAAASNSNVPVTFGYGAFTVDTRAILFAGEVSEWPQRWNVKGSDVTAPVEAAGIMRRLTQGARPLRSALTRYHTASSPVAWWPLEGDLTAGVAGVAPMAVVASQANRDNPQQYEVFTSPNVIGTASLADITKGVRLDGTVPVHPDTGTYAVEAVALFEPDPDANFSVDVFHTVYSGGTIAAVKVEADGDAHPSVTIETVSGGLTVVADSTRTVFDAKQRHWRAVIMQDGADVDVSLYVDGVLSVSASDTGETLGALKTVILNHPEEVTPQPSQRVGQLAVYASSAGDGATAAAGHAGETAVQRITRLCAEEGIPVAVPAGTDASAAMGAQPVGLLVDLLHEAADADQGILSEMRGALGLRYRPLASLYNQTPVTLDYTGGHLAPGLAPTDDDQHVHNDVTVSRPSGGTYRHTVTSGPLSTQAPPDGVGTYDRGAVEVNVQADGQLPAVAGWIAHLGTWDEPRWPAVPVQLSAPAIVADPELALTVLSADTGDLVTIDNPPAWLPPDPAVTMVQAVRADLDQWAPRVEFATTPAGPFTVGVLDGGRLDAAASTLATGVDGDDTSLSVTTTSGPLWTVDAGQVPFDIFVGGERMTVTAVAGASSPQTLTVTRSVNGVVKSHSSGAPVRLWTPLRLAL